MTIKEAIVGLIYETSADSPWYYFKSKSTATDLNCAVIKSVTKRAPNSACAAEDFQEWFNEAIATQSQQQGYVDLMGAFYQDSGFEQMTVFVLTSDKPAYTSAIYAVGLNYDGQVEGVYTYALEATD